MALIFWSNVVIQLVLIAGAVWSIALPSRRVYPMKSKDFFYYSMWFLFWVVFAEHAALVVLDWDSGSWTSPNRLVIGIPIAALGSALVTWGIVTNGIKNTSGLPGGLVTGGPFRHTRNPQYVGDIALFLGVSIIANSELVLVTHSLTSLMFVLAPFAEEPWLEEHYGEGYREYRARVSRFL